MCGIVGILGDMDWKVKDLFKDMLITCAVRGDDSAGIFSLKTDDGASPEIARVVGSPFELLSTIAWDKTSFYNRKFVVGHTRKATVGAIERRTAHPFNIDNITGVHNGTLRNWKDLPGESLRTDSETLFATMAREGDKETIAMTDGAYALVWFDENTGYLSFLRNEERPLSYAFSENGKIMLFASEAWMITIHADRHGFKLMDLPIEGKDYTQRTMPFTPNMLARVKVGSGPKPLTFLADEAVEGGTNKPVKPIVPFVRSGSGDPNAPWWDWRTKRTEAPLPLPSPNTASTKTADESGTTNKPSSDSQAKGSTPSATTATRAAKPTLTLVADNKKSGSEKLEKLNDAIIGLFGESDFLEGQNGVLLSKEEYDTLVDPNCVWCQEAHTFEELKDEQYFGDWCDDETYICSKCLVSTAMRGVR